MEWTVVVRGKRPSNKQQPQINLSQINFQKEVFASPAECNSVLDKLNRSKNLLEKSPFYKEFLKQVRGFQDFNESHFKNVLSSLESRPKSIQIVIYGLGRISESENSRIQLSLMLLLRRDVAALVDASVEVYDPVLSPVDRCVMQRLGCSIIATNEQGKRRVATPTLFFLPHCERQLYSNVLEANWGCRDCDATSHASSLHHVAILGNSFTKYRECTLSEREHIRASVSRGEEEFIVPLTSSDYEGPLWGTSWHFYPPDILT